MPPLWSQLCLTYKTDELLLVTLLGRVKQFPLDITLHYSWSPVPSVALFSPFVQQIRTLTLHRPRRDDIRNLSTAISGSLPLLGTLIIHDTRDVMSSRPLLALTSPLFGGAINVEDFYLCTHSSLRLSLFAFPNLTAFKFETRGDLERFSASLLLDFLEASPLLQVLDMTIADVISYEGVPPDNVLALPCVTYFRLDITSHTLGWKLATHLSCPSAGYAGFVRRLRSSYQSHMIPEDIFPPSPLWTAIVHQYPTGTVEEVELELGLELDKELTCSITFWTPRGTPLFMQYQHSITPGRSSMDMTWHVVGYCLFSQACSTIQDHPLLSNARILRITGGGLLAGNLELAIIDVGKLWESMGSLNKLVLRGCDLRPYLDAFLETPLFPGLALVQLTLFHPIKELTIIHPIQSLWDNEAYAAAIVELAKLQFAEGVPFEVMTFEPPVPPWVVEKLLLSVNTIQCDQLSPDSDGDQSYSRILLPA